MEGSWNKVYTNTKGQLYSCLTTIASHLNSGSWLSVSPTHIHLAQHRGAWVSSCSCHFLSILTYLDLLFLVSLPVSSFFPKFMLFSHWNDLFTHLWLVQILPILQNPRQVCLHWQSFLAFLANTNPLPVLWTPPPSLLGNLLLHFSLIIYFPLPY